MVYVSETDASYTLTSQPYRLPAVNLSKSLSYQDCYTCFNKPSKFFMTHVEAEAFCVSCPVTVLRSHLIKQKAFHNVGT